MSADTSLEPWACSAACVIGHESVDDHNQQSSISQPIKLQNCLELKPAGGHPLVPRSGIKAPRGQRGAQRRRQRRLEYIIVGTVVEVAP